MTERGQKLKGEIADLWAQGLSAYRIGEKLGLTRSCVIGHVYRMGLPKRKTVEGKACSQKPIIQRPKLVIPPPPPAESPPSMDLTIEALSDKTCRHPHGTQSPYTFCGHAVKHNSPYCPFHDSVNRPPGKPLLRKRA